MSIHLSTDCGVLPQRRSPASRAKSTQNAQAAAAALVAFVAAWSVYFAVTEAPFAIKHDMAEAYAWGQEFQLGYNQHPPFWAWVCGLWFSVMPHTQWAFGLLSAINAAIGLAGAWPLIGHFTSGGKRLAAWALLLTTPFYTLYAYKYDADTIFLSLWPWSLHYFLKSVERRRIPDALMLGGLIGLSLMSKYYAAILVASCFLAGVQHSAWWRYIRSGAPYISAVVAAVICAPHIVWLLVNDAPPLHYLANRSGLGWGLITSLTAKTGLSSLGSSLGLVLIVGWAAWTERRRGTQTAGRKLARLPADELPGATLPIATLPLGLLATLAVTPLVLTLVGALILRTRTTPDMPVGTFPLVPLLIIELIGIVDADRLARIACRLAVVVTIIAVVASPAITATRLWASHKLEATPYRDLGFEVTRLWHEHIGLKLAYVGGSDWCENAIAFYSPDRPHAFVHFDYTRNLWMTPQAVAEHGLLSACRASDRLCLAETAGFVTPSTIRIEETLVHRFLDFSGEPMPFVFTIIPPAR